MNFGGWVLCTTLLVFFTISVLISLHQRNESTNQRNYFNNLKRKLHADIFDLEKKEKHLNKSISEMDNLKSICETKLSKEQLKAESFQIQISSLNFEVKSSAETRRMLETENQQMKKQIFQLKNEKQRLLMNTNEEEKLEQNLNLQAPPLFNEVHPIHDLNPKLSQL